MSYYVWNWSKSLCAVRCGGWMGGLWCKPIIVFSLVQAEQLSIWVVFVLHTEFQPPAMLWSGQKVCVRVVVWCGGGLDQF